MKLTSNGVIIDNTSHSCVSCLCCFFGLLCLTPLSTIFQLYRGGIIIQLNLHEDDDMGIDVLVWEGDNTGASRVKPVQAIAS